MKTPQNPSALSTPALVRDLDDSTLRTGHALLDASRSRDFSEWLDEQLDDLETQFQDYLTPQSFRRSLGR